MIIVADTLLTVVLQKLNAAVHHHRGAGDVKSGFSRRTLDILRHAFGGSITNAINYRYAFYQFLVKLKNNRFTTDYALSFFCMKKADDLGI